MVAAVNLFESYIKKSAQKFSEDYDLDPRDVKSAFKQELNPSLVSVFWSPWRLE